MFKATRNIGCSAGCRCTGDSETVKYGVQVSSTKMKDGAQEQLDGESVAEVVVPIALD
jgi:hypothetical protein